MSNDIKIDIAEYERLNKIKESRTKQMKRQNEFIKDNYNRFSVTLPKKYTKEYINEITGESVNGLINRLVTDEIERREKLKLSDDELPFK